jgi:transcriptional regulator of acetoin/glycerol metabolism
MQLSLTQADSEYIQNNLISKVFDPFTNSERIRCASRVPSNMTDAAESMGLHRSSLYRKMKQLAMTEADDGGEGDSSETGDSIEL